MSEQKKIKYEWDNVDYDYPSCGGTKGIVYEDNTVEIEHESNIQGQHTGGKTSWQITDKDMIAKIDSDDLDDQYNDLHTYRDMLEGSIEYVADFIKDSQGILVQ